MKHPEKVIAVVGASGQQGKSVVEALVANGQFRVRAITRNPGQYKGAAHEVVYADLDQPESLNEAFRGAYGVFGVTNAWQPGTDEIAQCRAMIAAAKTQQVEHFVWSTLPHVERLSGGRFDVPHFTNKARMDSEVSAAGFRFHSFVVAAFYYQNFLAGLSPASNPDGSQGWMLPISPDADIAMADIAELGQLVAGVFIRPEQTGHGLYLPHVGSTLSFNGIVSQLKQQGADLRFSQVPIGLFAGTFPGSHELAQMLAWFEAHGYFGDDYTKERQLAAEFAGLKPTVFSDWAKANLKYGSATQ